MFGRASGPRPPASSSSSSSTTSSASRPNNLGRAILHPPHPRRGPTIDFDGPDLPADDDELVDEDARHKRRRTEDRGGFGRLDMCDEDVHAGFGTQGVNDDDERARRTKRSLEMDGFEGEVDVKPCTARAQGRRDGHVDAPPQHITLASSSSPTASAVDVAADDGSELEPEPSTASSGSSAERDLQAQLVPPPPLKRAPRVLVPDSDPPSGPDDEGDDDEAKTVSDDDREDELDALVERLGGRRKGGAGAAAGVDDSGFAEVSGMDVEPGEDADVDERDETPSPRDVHGADAVMDLTVVPSSSPLVSNAHELLGPPPQLARPALRHDADSSSSSGSGGSSLGRTASGILMPPPALPRKRLRRGAPSTRAAELEAEAEAEAQARARVLVEDTQVRSPNKVGAPRERAAPRPYMVVCDETQSQSQLDLGGADLERYGEPLPLPPIPHYRTLPRLPRPPNLAGSGAVSSPAAGGPGGAAAAGGAFLSSDPDHLPPLPTPRPLAVPLSPSPARPRTDAAVAPPPTELERERAAPPDPAWASLASAWAGARPPSPGPPRQTLLGDFFAVVPASQACGGDEGEVVEDSQMPLGGAAESALEEALRRQKAVNLARERGAGSASTPAVRVVEEGKAGEGLEAGLEEEEVPDSDPEDDAPALSPSLRRTILLPTSTSTRAAPLSPSPRPLCPTTAPPLPFARPTSSTPAARTATTTAAGAIPGPPSPLGTPIRKRFPRYSPGKMRRAVERFAGASAAPRSGVAVAEAAAAGAHDVLDAVPEPAQDAREGAVAAAPGEGDERGPSVGAGAGAGADETQWESYWSYPTSSGEYAARAAAVGEGPSARGEQPADELEDEEEEDDEESLRLPAGWTRSARGELVRVATPAQTAQTAQTARAEVSDELGGFEDETLTGW